jgi:hypothetical protein
MAKSKPKTTTNPLLDGLGNLGNVPTPTPKTVKESKDAEDRKHVHSPFAVAPNMSSPYGEANHGHPPHVHHGTDYAMPFGTKLYAMVKSKVVNTGYWDNGSLITLRALEDRGNIKKGDQFGYGHASSVSVSVGQVVEAGTLIGKSGYSSAPHCHLWMQRPAAEPGTDGNTNVAPIVTYAAGGKAAPINGPGPPNPAGGGTSNDPMAAAKQAAFSTILGFPSAINSVESLALTGQRSLMNDQELFPFIEQICAASLRNFMSMPDGKFYAFYPDYFGGFGRGPYWKISDIEILSGKIDLSDDTLATHVFIVGDTSPGQNATAVGFGTIDYLDKMTSTGVISIFNAFATGFLNGKPKDPKKATDNLPPDEMDETKALNFLKKYGARRYYEEVPAVRSPIYETFLAFQRFCLLWASQFKTSFEFTFMPELYPGGIVAFPEHGLQCYVEEVIHSGSYEDGFTTIAQLSAPAALKEANKDPDREWIHAGMIRAFVNDFNSTPKDAYDKKPPKKKGKKK